MRHMVVSELKPPTGHADLKSAGMYFVVTLDKTAYCITLPWADRSGGPTIASNCSRENTNLGYLGFITPSLGLYVTVFPLTESVILHRCSFREAVSTDSSALLSDATLS